MPHGPRSSAHSANRTGRCSARARKTITPPLRGGPLDAPPSAQASSNDLRPDGSPEPVTHGGLPPSSVPARQRGTVLPGPGAAACRPIVRSFLRRGFPGVRAALDHGPDALAALTPAPSFQEHIWTSVRPATYRLVVGGLRGFTRRRRAGRRGGCANCAWAGSRSRGSARCPVMPSDVADATSAASAGKRAHTLLRPTT
jgi:hypothetical protein